MKLVLLLAVVGAVAASHIPGHVDYPLVFTRRAMTELPTVLTEGIADQPVVVVTKTTRFAPEMLAVFAERGINNLPESFDSFHDVLRVYNEELTLCNGAQLGGDVEFCVEKPISKFFVPESFKDMSMARIVSDMSSMPWVHIPSLFTSRSAPISMSEIELFDKPLISTHAIASSEALGDDIFVKSLNFKPAHHLKYSLFPSTHLMRSFAPRVVADDAIVKSLSFERSSPFAHSHGVHKHFTDDAFLKTASFEKPLSFAYPYAQKMAFFPWHVTEEESKIAHPLSYRTSEVLHKPLLKYEKVIAKPIIKYDEVIAKPFEVKSFDEIIEKPFIGRNFDEFIAKPTFKSYNEVITKPIFKHYNTDFISKPVYKSFESFSDYPSVLPVSKSYVVPQFTFQ